MLTLNFICLSFLQSHCLSSFHRILGYAEHLLPTNAVLHFGMLLTDSQGSISDSHLAVQCRTFCNGISFCAVPDTFCCVFYFALLSLRRVFFRSVSCTRSSVLLGTHRYIYSTTDLPPKTIFRTQRRLFQFSLSCLPIMLLYHSCAQ